MCLLTLDFFQRTVDPHIRAFHIRAIKSGVAQVSRVSFEYEVGFTGVPAVIVKMQRPSSRDDSSDMRRECLFYAELLPAIDFVQFHVFHADFDGSSRCSIIVMEDLSDRFAFPPPQHGWSGDEIRCALRAYARLHASGRQSLTCSRNRDWMLNVQETRWEPEGLLRMVADLVSAGIWGSLPRLDQLIERTLVRATQLADCPMTLIHNDVYPPNIGLPFDLDKNAVLIDWDMGGRGMAELDLAYMFMLPFRSTRDIDRSAALEYYWTQRVALEGSRPARDEQRAAQHHADSLWALYLIPVAHHVAANPYPPGSAPRKYWDAMFGVLHGRLTELSG